MKLAAETQTSRAMDLASQCEQESDVNLRVQKFKVELLVTTNHPLYHGSSTLSGLVLLANRGLIDLRIRRGEALDAGPRALICLLIRMPDGTQRTLIIDFADSADSFSIPGLEKSDVYFKRSFVSSCVCNLSVPRDLQERIVPFGLNFASLSSRAVGKHLHIAASLLAQRLTASGVSSLKFALRDFVQRSQLIYGIPPAAAFERRTERKSANSRGAVLLQTRLWPPQPGSDDLEAVNMARIALVQSLRKGLGNQFSGGIVADGFSERHCPTDLLIQHANMRAYAPAVRGAQIGVYVRGLHHSLAFKMAEYLAAGLCIVSEPLIHELPVPLQEGVNYLSFRSHDECLAHCSWLLSHPTEAARMRSANLEYYRKWVEPAAHMWNVLNKGVQITTR